MANTPKLPESDSTLPSWTEETDVFLLMSKKTQQARGFYDAGGRRMFTFAFTTRDKAQAFVENARRLGVLTDIDLLYRITIGEFFEWKETGRTKSDLTIDPDPEMLEHPIFTSTAHQHN